MKGARGTIQEKKLEQTPDPAIIAAIRDEICAN
jgi:hypothetical protein